MVKNDAHLCNIGHIVHTEVVNTVNFAASTEHPKYTQHAYTHIAHYIQQDKPSAGLLPFMPVIFFL